MVGGSKRVLRRNEVRFGEFFETVTTLGAWYCKNLLFYALMVQTLIPD
jgi:hypothetical protein